MSKVCILCHQDAKTLLQEEQKLMERVDTDVDYNMEGNVIWLSLTFCLRKQVINSRPGRPRHYTRTLQLRLDGQVAHNLLDLDRKSLSGKGAGKLDPEVDVRTIQRFLYK